MASPVPEAGASVESRPVDATSEKGTASEVQPKPEVNGHSSTTKSAPPQPESGKPLSNGNTHAKEPETSEGTAKEDEKMTEADAPPTNETSVPSEPQEIAKPAVPDAKPEESTEAREPAKEPTPPKSPKDVDMEDAKPESETQPEVQDKKAEPEPAPAPADASKDTTEKSKDDEPKNEEKDSIASDKADKKPVADATTTSEGDLEPVGMSQLAIETAEGDASKIQSSVEVSMTDAPTIKSVREREDDAEEGPAAKRAKTEPKEDADADAEVDVATPAPPSADGGVLNFPKARFDEFEFWYDADNDAKPMTQHRIREIRKVVDRIKKTKAGAVFRDSVQKLWPGLWDKYSARIEKPMDLAELGRGLRDNKYKTLGEFKSDLALILENSQQYNGPDHDITMSARTALITLWNDVKIVAEEEPTRTKQAPKPPRVRESRSAYVKPEGPSPGEPAETSPVAGSIGVSLPPPTKPAPATGGADARRASTATEGDRPKRTVRAPKSKDIDYTAKPSRKKLKPELQFCDEVLQELMSPKHWAWNQWFLNPVDAEGLGIPDYYSIIKHPMDLNKVSKMLGTGEIASVKDFDKNVKLIFDNCYQFNGPPDQNGVSSFAKQLQDLYTSQMKQKDSWLAKQAKANPPPASVSNASDDDEDEEEEEAEEAPIPPEMAQEIKDLEARLREESKKHNDLFLADSPNQIMIDMQGNIVKMMQDALLKAKANLHEHRQKNGGAKPAKKSKPAKAKAAAGGGAARKATGAAAAPKKPGNPKKKKNLTAADKDNIANAINDLEGPHLDRAIDIIKRDTGQMESEDGELELDIDQLSPEALLKLWELCKKILPGFGKDPNAAAKASPEAHRSTPAKQAGKPASSKSKKNKPMSAHEQEARIARLKEIQDMYQGGRNPDEAPATQDELKAMEGQDSSDDSSEEE